VTTALITVKLAAPLMDPEVAVIVVIPSATPVATPVVATVATTVLEEVHVAEEVKFCVLPSLYVPVATKGCRFPTPIEGAAGVTAMDCRIVCVIVIGVDPETEL
jgi:hypothetical protein